MPYDEKNKQEQSMAKTTKTKPSKILEPASFGVKATTTFIYLTLFAINFFEIPELQGKYESLIYDINVLVGAGQGGLLLLVTIAICAMLVAAQSQPFRFFTRYAILIFVLTIYPLPYVYWHLPWILSLIILVLLFALPVIKFYQYIQARCSMSTADRKKYNKAIAVRLEDDAKKQKKYSIISIVIGVIVSIPTLIAFFGSMTSTLAFISSIFGFLLGMPLGLIVSIILIAYIVRIREKLSTSTILLCIAGIILCLSPILLLLVDSFFR